MLSEFLNIFFKSLKLDKDLYKETKYFGEAAIYFAGLIPECNARDNVLRHG